MASRRISLDDLLDQEFVRWSGRSRLLNADDLLRSHFRVLRILRDLVSLTGHGGEQIDVEDEE